MENTKPVQPKNNKSRNIIIVVILVIAACVCCGLLIAVLAFFGVFTTKDVVINNVTEQNPVANTTTPTTNTTNSTSNNQPAQPTTKTFVGKFVIATIPTNWSIKEYSDKNGMSAYADTGSVTFSGLTGLEILNESNSVVFSFKGIDGIGGGGGCSTVGKFADTQASYIQSVEDETELMGFDSTIVVDLTNSNYTELDLLNERFRRVDNDLYVAKTFSSYFNPACGIEGQFIKLDELNFTITDSGDTYTANAYKFGISSSVTDQETLTKLDEVLKTLKAKNIS